MDTNKVDFDQVLKISHFKKAKTFTFDLAFEYNLSMDFTGANGTSLQEVIKNIENNDK